MNYRKTRNHQTGTSNLSPRPNFTEISFTKSGSLAPLQSKTLPKSLSINFETQGSPSKKTELFYASSGKSLRIKPQISVPRSSQLEETEKRKLAFTGESLLVYDRHLEKYRDLDTSDILSPNPLIKKEEKEQLIKEKKYVHGTAVQETQLVGFDKYSADTLKNNVNLEKVREAKRILRRKYANRNQLQKIYAAWDVDSKGTISLDNMFFMSKNLGLNLNVDEARVLLASANKSGTGYLTLDEFLDLIYNKDDALNVDLDQLSAQLGSDYLVKKEELYRDDDNIIKKLEQNAKQMRNTKHMNQVNLVLKNKIHQIASMLLSADPNKLGYISFEKFKENLQHLGINENIVSETDIVALFDKFKSEDQHTVNYKAFIESLRKFKFSYEEMYTEQKEGDNAVLKTLPEDRAEPEEVNIVDCRNLPYNTMMNYLWRTRNVNTAIKRYFPTRETFRDYLSKTLSTKVDGIEERPISKKDLKTLVEGLFNNFDNVTLTKKDFEGFLSTFLYNKHGFTNLKEVCEIVYEEDEKEYFRKIVHKKSGPPPHAQIASIDGSNTIDHQDIAVSQEIGENNDNFSSPIKSIKRSDIQPILEKLDNKIFMGRKRHHEIFKSFDVDKDGYISHKDLARKIDEFAVLGKEEIPQLLEYLDPQHKGYVKFREFTHKIRPNMAQEDENGEQLILPFITPTKEFNQKLNPKDYRKKINDIAGGSHYPHTTRNTRFGASPTWSNTFVNFHPPSDSGMFISINEMYKSGHANRTDFQKEEQAKATTILSARLDLKRAHTEFMTKNIEKGTSRLESITESSLKKKALEQTLYERRAKLRNDFAH